MKKTTLFALTAGFGLAAMGAATAGHHEGKEGDYAAKAEAKLEKKFAKVDADGNGTITADEYMAYKTAEAESEWAKWTDGDADGAVTLEEAKAMQAAHMAEKKAKMEEKKKDM